MTIKVKLRINAVVVLVAMTFVVGAAVIGIRSIRGNINELTQKTTPYQLKALNQQRALQAHAASLLTMSTAASLGEYKQSAEGVSSTLSQVKKAGEDIAKLRAGASSEDRAISDLTGSILNTVEKKLVAHDTAAAAVNAIKARVAEASRKMKELDTSIRRLQQGTAGTMITGVDGLIAANQQVTNLSIVRDGFKDLNLYISRIPSTNDKRSVAQLRENIGATIKNVIQALKNTKGMEKAAGDMLQRLNVLNEKVTAAKGLAALKLKQINDEDDSLKERIETLAKEGSYEITYMMPTVEREMENASSALKATTGGMSKQVNAFSDTNNVLTLSSSLSLLNASIESHINHCINERNRQGFESAVVLINSLIAQADATGQKLRALLSKGNYQNEMKMLSASLGALAAMKSEFSKQGGVVERLRASLAHLEELEKLNARMKDIVAKQLEESNKEVSVAGSNQEAAVLSVNKVANSTIVMVGLVGVSAVIIALIMGGWISASISNPLRETADMVIDISKGSGDLTRRLSVKSNDEIGAVCKGFNDLVEKLHTSISHVSEKVDIVVTSASELSATAEQLSRGSQSQAEQTTSLSSSADEMSHAILDVARNAQSTSEAAEETRKMAQSGEEVVRDAIEGIKAVAASIDTISSSIDELSRDSEKIGEISSVIKDIADQTNLLALNAAIEAARAGEQGRGFAVVADSVRQLAERTAAATTEIAGMIKSIQGGAHRSSTHMRQGLEDVSNVVARANRAEESLKEIVRKIEEQTGLIRHMATASNQQSVTVDSMVTNINGVADASKEFASGTAQIARTAEDLDKVAGELQGVVKQFRL